MKYLFLYHNIVQENSSSLGNHLRLFMLDVYFGRLFCSCNTLSDIKYPHGKMVSAATSSIALDGVDSTWFSRRVDVFCNIAAFMFISKLK